MTRFLMQSMVERLMQLLLPLLQTTSRFESKSKTQSTEFLAQVNGFELNTERETVDTTTLSDEFRSRISTLMSGSGRMSAFWEYTGNRVKNCLTILVEPSLRTRVGSQFKARFYIKTTMSTTLVV